MQWLRGSQHPPGASEFASGSQRMGVGEQLSVQTGICLECRWGWEKGVMPFTSGVGTCSVLGARSGSVCI